MARYILRSCAWLLLGCSLRVAAGKGRSPVIAALARLGDETTMRNSFACAPLDELMAEAEAATLAAHGTVVTYSPKVFIPLTRLCRDVCHYCTFATTPRVVGRPYLSIDEVLEIARAGQQAGCREALFTLGDSPESRYSAALAALDEMGCASTLEYLARAAAAVVTETGLLPHFNAGLMTGDDISMLRPHAASMGLMLESSAERLCAPGGPHCGSPDKHPALRLQTIAAAGRARVPFTTGVLIGIGETREERIQSLEAIRDLHARYGHIQEVIIQNFQPKPGTKMASHAPAPLEEQLWTTAVARLILGPEMTIQAPPNLRPQALQQLLRAGVNDWGGVSPVTPDHVNPEAPWPHLARLEADTAAAGRVLRQRLTIGPAFARHTELWLDPGLQPRVRRAIDGRGLPYEDGWRAGRGDDAPEFPPAAKAGQRTRISGEVSLAVRRMEQGGRPQARHIETLFAADGADVRFIFQSADNLRRSAVGDAITYVRNRNINYTNICLYKCGFCAFSKGTARALRGAAYKLDLEEVARRAVEARARGATEVCLQGGIHPEYDGSTYLAILGAVRDAAPDLHIHAFSPLEISHGAATLGLSLSEFLVQLKEAGLSTLPGTAAEIFDDDVRAIICPDKVSATQWVEVMRAAHRLGLRSTATIMFGHIDGYAHWARHLLTVRDLQEETGGFTEFVPLPFVHMEAPIWRKGAARSGPSYRETVLMHAIARLSLHPLVPNIQTSWVKMGVEGAAACLQAGANDIGGTLMGESITRAAGGVNGQELDVDGMSEVATRLGRSLIPRSTLYQPVGARAPETQARTLSQVS